MTAKIEQTDEYTRGFMDAIWYIQHIISFKVEIKSLDEAKEEMARVQDLLCVLWEGGNELRWYSLNSEVERLIPKSKDL